MTDTKTVVQPNWKAPQLRKLGTLRDVAGTGQGGKQLSPTPKS